MNLYKKIKNPIGLDISDLTLRFVQLKGRGRGARLYAFNEIDIPAGYIIKGRIENKEGTKSIIKKLFQTSKLHKVTQKSLIVSLPEDKSFIKVIEVPYLDRENILPSLLKEAERHIPLPFEELYFDWKVIKEDKEEKKVWVLTGATPKGIVDDYNGIFEEIGLSTLVFEIESVAIARALIKREKEKDTSTIIVDIGFDRTTFVIFDMGTIQYAASTTNISGNSMTELLAQNMKIYPKTAEKLKRKRGIDSKTINALSPFLDNFNHRITDVVSFCRDHCSSRKELKQVILCGGGANTKHFKKHLEDKFQLKVVTGDPWINLPHLGKTKHITTDKSLSYVTAIGLAMRSVLSKDFI